MVQREPKDCREEHRPRGGYHEPPGPEGVAPKHSKTALEAAAKKTASNLSNAEIKPSDKVKLREIHLNKDEIVNALIWELDENKENGHYILCVSPKSDSETEINWQDEKPRFMQYGDFFPNFVCELEIESFFDMDSIYNETDFDWNYVRSESIDDGMTEDEANEQVQLAMRDTKEICKFNLLDVVHYEDAEGVVQYSYRIIWKE